MNDNNKKTHKIISLILVVVAILLLGVGITTFFLSNSEKTMVCKEKETYLQDEISIHYVKNEAEKVSFKIVYDLSVMKEEQFADLKKDIKEKVNLCRDHNKAIDDFEIVSCDQEIVEDVITATLDLNIKSDELKDYDKMQDYLLNQGFTCE